MSLRSFPLRALALVFAVAFLAGCDTLAEEDTAELTFEAPTIAFEFDPEDFDGTTELEGMADDLGGETLTEALVAFLDDNGFERSDIESVTPTSVRLRIVQPGRETIDFLTFARLKLEAPGRSATPIAEATVFPESSDVSLEPSAGNLAPWFQARDLTMLLEINGSPNIMDMTGDYRLEAIADFDIVVAL